MSEYQESEPSTSTFSRPTIIAACNLLSDFGHSQFDNLMLQFGAEDRVTSGGGYSLQNKANDLARFVLGNPSFQVDLSEGSMSLQEAIVHKATKVMPWVRQAHEWTAFCTGLERDGFSLIEDEDGRTVHLRRMHPEIADISAADDEVHLLLRQHDFTTPLGHLEQAITNHAIGHWASANSQIRSFLEGLFDDIAERIAPDKCSEGNKGHGRRAVLANLDDPFLSKALFEWSDDRGHALIPGLFKRLNPEGSHPGLSEEEDCTFRLHIALITARLVLRRITKRIGKNNI